MNEENNFDNVKETETETEMKTETETETPITVPPEKKRSALPFILLLLVMVGAGVFLPMLSRGGNTADAPGETSETLLTVAVGTGAGITVNINQSERPRLGEEAYENIETGLFTETGIADWVIPSQRSIVVYIKDTLAPDTYGTGTIISEDGYMLTCAHVVSGAIAVKVLTEDSVIAAEDVYVDAEIIAIEEYSDLALIKIDAEGLVPVIFGKSTDVVLGEKVVCASAAGRYPDTLTFGNLTNKDRRVRNGFINDDSVPMMQVSCLVNPGASGGPVFNMYGQCIGIVDSKITSPFEGVGFIINSDYAVSAIERMMGTTGKYPEGAEVVTASREGFTVTDPAVSTTKFGETTSDAFFASDTAIPDDDTEQ